MGHADVVDVLLKNGANVNAMLHGFVGAKSPLMAAVILMAHGADAHYMDDAIIREATRRNLTEIVSILAN
ncbi:hypothetical protein HDU76_010639 [Blyttiomyces sp. JEL0837]|nr:hypothetical protein HDU76_010639 [Blyttiomyces sp. JEL0837]